MTDFTDIFLSSRRLLSDVVAKIVPQNEVEDIVQETFVKAHLVRNKSDIKKPAAFMVQIAKNLAFDYVKSARHRTHCDVGDDFIEYIDNMERDNHNDVTWNKVASQQDFSRFCKEVKKLPEKCRKVYVLKKVYGYSQKEIAEMEGISTSTVEKHLAYGTKRLFHLMRDQIETSKELRKQDIKNQPAMGECS